MDLSHLPPDVAKALNDYDEEVKDGEIKFGKEGFADEFPDRCSSDNDLPSFLASKIPGF